MLLDNTCLLVESRLGKAIARHPLLTSPNTLVVEAIATMSQARVTCSIDDPQSMSIETSLAMELEEARASCILVMDGATVVGIFTERDVVRLVAMGIHYATLTMADVMSRNVITLATSEVKDVFNLLMVLRQHQIRHLPILDQDGYPVGLVTPEGLRQILQPVDLLRLRLVSEVMTTHVVQAAPHNSMLEVAMLMATHRVSCVVITEAMVDSQSEDLDTASLSRPIGIVTERDVVQFQALGLDFETITAVNVMSSPVFSLHPTDSLWMAHQTMQQRRVQRLVVTDDRAALLGIVTQTSLLSVLNPLEVHTLLDVLQQKVQQLEKERLILLQQQNDLLEQQVHRRTVELQKQVDCDRILSTIITQIHKTVDLQEILEITVAHVQQNLQADRVLVCQFDRNRNSTVVAESVVSPWRSLLGLNMSHECFPANCVAPYLDGYFRVVDDVAMDNLSPCHRDLLEQMQVQAKVLMPILLGGHLWGFLVMHQCRSPRHWEALEIDTLKKLAIQLAIAIQQAELYQRTQQELLERQRVEAELRDSKQRYANLAKVAPVGIFRTDEAGLCLYVNDVWSTIVGISPVAAQGLGWIAGLYPDDRPMVVAAWEQTTQQQAQFRLEFRFQRPDGTISWVLGQAVPELDSHGTCIGYIGTVTDITERKQSETALNNLVEGTASVTGRDFFAALVRYIADALHVRHAVVSKYLSNGDMQTLGLWSDGHLQPNQIINCNQLPCQVTLRRGTYCCPDQLEQVFPEHPLLAQLGARSYQGVAMQNAQGDPIGTLCIFHDQKLVDATRIEAILRVFAARAAAELERQTAIEALQRLNQELEDRVSDRTRALQESEQFIQTVLDTVPLPVFWKDRNSTFLGCNHQFAKVLGLQSTGDVIGKTDFELSPTEGEAIAYRADDALVMVSGIAKLGIQETLTLPNGAVHWIETHKLPLRNTTDEVVGVVVTFQDITDRKAAELAMKQQLAAIEAAIDGIAILQGNNYIYLNKAHLELFGYTEVELMGQSWQQLYSAAELERFGQEIFPVLLRDRAWQGEATATRKDGSTFSEGLSLTFTDEGLLICVCRDISDQKQAEEQLKSSLQEKELLLKEVHHRVKNNLLVVASLLDWQTDYIHDPATLKIFEESQNRIHSMALIHEKLYQSQNLDRIDLGEYLKTLAEYLIHSFNLDLNRIRFHYELEPIFLNIETATPCGLIVSELIANTLEHAFVGLMEGEVLVSVKVNEAQQVVLTIRDNGVGFPTEINFRETDSLGLQLVCLLAQQIQADLELNRVGGTEFKLTFSELNYRRRL